MLRLTGLLVFALLASGCSPLTIVSAVSASDHYQSFPDLPYGDAERQRLDVYQPLGAQPDAPLVVFFYGGAWDNGDRADFEFVATSLTRAGIVVVIPDYRLYPDVIFPEYMHDAANAVAWAIDQADQYGADPERIYVMGHSAGAQIASLLALDGRYLADAGQDADRIAGLIGLSGPYDFLPIENSYLTRLFPEDVRDDSQAINFVSPDAPPTLLIHGEADAIVEAGNSARLAAKLREADVPVRYLPYDGVGHIRVIMALAPPFDFIAATLDDCIRFIVDNEQRPL